MNSIKIFVLLVIALFINISCSSNKLEVQNFKYSYCSTKLFRKENFVMDSIKDYKYISQSKLSENNKLMCRILGVSEQADELLKLKKSLEKNNIRILELKQEITQKISLAKTDLDAFISELDCEEERADMAAAYLDDINEKRNTKLTVGSVILGALTTVATVLIKDNNTETAVGVSGGLISAGLGALTIKPKGKTVEYYHQRNILTPIWIKSNKNKEYPDFIWNIFQLKEVHNSDSVSLLEGTKERWVSFVLDHNLDKKQELLYFGAGGEYTADELHTRSDMVDQVKSSTRYINQLLSVFESSLYEAYK